MLVDDDDVDSGANLYRDYSFDNMIVWLSQLNFNDRDRVLYMVHVTSSRDWSTFMSLVLEAFDDFRGSVVTKSDNYTYRISSGEKSYILPDEYAALIMCSCYRALDADEDKEDFDTWKNRVSLILNKLECSISQNH